MATQFLHHRGLFKVNIYLYSLEAASLLQYYIVSYDIQKAKTSHVIENEGFKYE